MPLQNRKSKDREKAKQMALVTAALIALTAAAQLIGEVISLIHH